MPTTSCAARAAAFLSPSTVFVFLAAALLGAALPYAAAMADPAAAGPPAPTAGENRNELEEIVVTAEKRESTVQATPISITALSAGDLAEQNITSVEDMIGKVPGISLRTAGPGQTEYEMRGLSAGGGTAGPVGFYIDEKPPVAAAGGV